MTRLPTRSGRQIACLKLNQKQLVELLELVCNLVLLNILSLPGNWHHIRSENTRPVTI